MMRLRNLVLSMSLGTMLVITLLIAMSLCTSSLQAQTAMSPTIPTIDHSEPISKALAYICDQQQSDGGIDAFGFGSSNDSGTARAVLALAAAGRSMEWMTSVSGTTMLDYLAVHAITYTHDASGTTSANLFPENAGLLLAAVAAANKDATNFGGMNLSTELNDTYHPATGAYSTTAKQGWSSGAASDINQAWAILGLSAAGQPVPVTATNYLISRQATDGSWYSSDPDVTAYAVVALVGSGNVQPTDAAIQEALGYFRDNQLSNGGWRPYWDTDPLNADSTGWVIQALVAAGYTPATESWAASPNPHEALLSLQQPNGSIGGTYVNAYSTIEALFGLTEQPLFFLGREHRALRALTWMNEHQSDDGSWPGFFGGPDTGGTIDAVLAYATVGFDPDMVMAGGSTNSALDYLKTDAFTYTRDVTGTILPAQAGKLILGAIAADSDPTTFGMYPTGHGSAGIPINLVNELTATYNAASGAYSTTAKKGYSNGTAGTINQAWAMLGLAAAGETLPNKAAEFLVSQQQNDGSWDSFVDTTGTALQALIAAGVQPTETAVVSATTYLKNQQDAQGGWGNANSTAYAMQGLLAIGEDMVADWSSEDGHSPYDALVTYQKVDGPFVWMWNSPWGPPADDLFATRQAVPALLGVHYPFSPTAPVPFSAVNRGPDPDRVVAVLPRAMWGNSVDVIIPFGSDLNADGSVELDWRVGGETEWVTGTTVYRADGYFTATLPLTEPVPYEFRATFQDSNDSVQYGSSVSETVELPSVTLEPCQIYLPLVLK